MGRMGAIVALLALVSGAAGAEPPSVDAIEKTLLEAHRERSQGRVGEARTLLKAAIEALERRAPGELLGTAWFQLGLVERDAERVDEALAALEKAREAYEAALGAGDPNVTATLEVLAGTEQAAGRFEAAATRWEAVAARHREAQGKQHPKVAQALGNQALALVELGRADEAAAVLAESAGIYERYPELKASAAAVLGELGRLERSRGRYEAARAALVRAVAAERAAHGERARPVARALNDLGLALVELGRHQEARERFEEALSIQEETEGDRSFGMARTLNNLAMSHRQTGDHGRALPRYQRALELTVALEGRESATSAVMMDNLANCLVDVAEYDRARLLYEEAQRVFEGLGETGRTSLARNLTGQARLLKHAGDFEGALVFARRSFEVLRAALGSEHPDVGVVADNLGTALADLGRHEEALAAYRQGLAIHEKQLGGEHPRVATALNNAAWVLKELGRYEEARGLYERAVAVADEALGADHPVSTGAATALGETWRALGDVPKARRIQATALARTKRALGRHHPYVAERRASYALTLLAAGDERGARREAEAALDVVERTVDALLYSTSERERLGLVQSHRDKIDLFVALTDDPRESWDASLRWKASVMSSLLAQRERLSAAAEPEVAEKMQELGQLRETLATVTVAVPAPAEREATRARIETLRIEKERLERALSRASVGFEREQAYLGAGPAEVCQALKKGQALVDFVRYHGAEVAEGLVRRVARYAAFVVAAGRCKMVQRIELGPAEPLESAVSELRTLIAEGADADLIIDALRQVGGLVWEPVSPALGGADFVWLVPDAALHGVPFAALPVGPRGLPEETRFLVERLTLSTLPTAKDVLRLAARTPARGGGRLVVGGVDYEQSGKSTGPAVASRGAGCGLSGKLDYGFLPGSAEEADQVAALMGSGTTLKGAEATERAVTEALPKSRIVHLATHGYFADGCRSGLAAGSGRGDAVGVNPLVLSGVALAGANRDRSVRAAGEGDGILTAEEVAALDLSGVDLAILSACETGLGDVATGEGVLGLRWAFSVAGAGALVMSLWKVPDEETRQLMFALHGHLKAEGPIRVAEALRGAQVSLLEKLRADGDPNPWLWAAFITSGR